MPAPTVPCRHRPVTLSPARRHWPDNMIWDNMMWGSDYPHSESTFPQSRKILVGVPDDEQVKPSPDHDPGIAALSAMSFCPDRWLTWGRTGPR